MDSRTTGKTKQERRREREKRQRANTVQAVFEWLESVLFALVFVMVLFTFVFKTYTVDGVSMEPTLHTGDFILGYCFLYSPQPGDIVIIDGSNSYGKPLIKRVIALGGQVVDIDENGTITVDGALYSYYETTSIRNLQGDATYPLVVPEGYVFVMGDNRGSSLDSRYSRVGFVDERSIVGKEWYTIQ